MIRTTVGCMTSLAIVFAAAAAAEQYPSQQRGLSASTAYQLSDDINAINLFNLNSVTRISVGPSYQVGPGLSYEIVLINNTSWDYQEEECVWDGQVWPYAVPVPDPRTAAGHGWMLNLGKIYAPNHEPFNKTNDWIYVSGDGGQHRLREQLHPGHPAPDTQYFTWFSADSSYLRLKRYSHTTSIGAVPPPNALTGTDCYTLEFPDGTMHEYHGFPAPVSDWRLTRM
ncbi:MAG: hypothetical protein GY842_06520, partial [bacterium]|nr:hypothetical protein [bacterium]